MKFPVNFQMSSLEVLPLPLTVCVLAVVTNILKHSEVNLRMDIKLIQDTSSCLHISCRVIQAQTSFELPLRKPGRVASLGLLLKTSTNINIYIKFLKHNEDPVWYLIIRKLNTK